eukprot:jgi/Tetstr1/462773/TSEL_007724.t1
MLSASSSSNIDLRFLDVSLGAYGGGARKVFKSTHTKAERAKFQKAVTSVPAEAVAQAMAPAAPPASAEAMDKAVAASTCPHPLPPSPMHITTYLEMRNRKCTRIAKRIASLGIGGPHYHFLTP